METLGICLICTLQNAPDLIYSGWPTYWWDPPRGRLCAAAWAPATTPQIACPPRAYTISVAACSHCGGLGWRPRSLAPRSHLLDSPPLSQFLSSPPFPTVAQLQFGGPEGQLPAQGSLPKMITNNGQSATLRDLGIILQAILLVVPPPTSRALAWGRTCPASAKRRNRPQDAY